MPYPRTPAHLRILSGNPSKRPIPSQPQPETKAPSCPEHLAGEARAEWERIAPELLRLGLLSHIDRAALAAYCVAYGRWVEAEKHLNQHGLTNGEKKSPYLLIAEKALDTLRKFSNEFGLTPASRSKVSAQPPSDDDDGFFT